MKQYRYVDEVLEAGSAELLTVLTQAYESKIRLHCLCTSGGVPMYIARAGETLILKRMPGTGSLHDSECSSYESPAGLNGRGEVDGSAIQEDIESGLTSLRFDFALTKRSGGKAPPPPGEDPDSVTSNPKKLSLRGLLHYLWDEAGFNKWSPAMADKRSWYVIRKYLYEAVELSRAKGIPLADLLFIPESFKLEIKDEIAGRRSKLLAPLYTAQPGPRPLRIVVGEVNRLEPTRFGSRLVVKHLPDFPFFMDSDLSKRLTKAFGAEIEMWGTEEGAHLVAIASFGMSPALNPTLEEVTLCLFEQNWLPIEDGYDAQITRELVRSKRRFVKGMRYNLNKTTPISTAVLSDTPEKPTALFIIPHGASEAYLEEIAALNENSGLFSWIWKVAESGLPALPDSGLHKAPGHA